ncbi:MAG: hypothetical protein AAGF11_29320 [Myxococcota bacterium]
MRARNDCAQTPFCEGAPYVIGMGIGVPLLAVGTISTLVFAGMLVGHASKRPETPTTARLGKRRRVALAPSLGGVTLRW